MRRNTTAIILVCGVLFLSACPNPIVPDSGKAITSYIVVDPPALGAISGTEIAVTVPFGTAVTSLVTAFTTTGATVLVDGTEQTSGTTANDFTLPVVYTVGAEDGTTQDYTVTVSVAARSSKEIAAFILTEPFLILGAIDEANRAIAVTVPYGIPVTNLEPTIVHSGTSLVPASGTPRDFTAPLDYTVSAADGTTRVYTVTVTHSDPYRVTYAAGSGRSSGEVPVDGNGYAYGAAVTVSANSGRLVGPALRDGIRQRFASWNTEPDGSGTPYAASDSFAITADRTLYAVYTSDTGVVGKVGPAGGWVFYDAGATETWGRYMESSYADLPYTPKWGSFTVDIPGADLSDLGAGRQNTLDIIAGNPLFFNKAADRCSEYSVDFDGTTYDDWFLPSSYELGTMASALEGAGAGVLSRATGYWSSTEIDTGSAVTVLYSGGWTNDIASKAWNGLVRAVRYF